MLSNFKFKLTLIGFLLFVMFIPTTDAQFPADLPIPDPQEITGQINIGLDDFSAPSVEINVLYSGTLGGAAQLNAQTNNIDDYGSLFEWYLDDQLIIQQSGRAKISFVFQTTKPQHLVRLVISDLQKRKITESAASINSYDVFLAWRANSFVPPDYDARALPSVGSRIVVTAIPEIKNESPENLIYTWYVNSESQVRGVLGEQTFSFRISKNVSFVPVMVEVSNLSQSITVRKGISIPIVRPALAVYQKYGQRLTLGQQFYAIAGNKSEFVAKPFYFHIAKATDLIFKWHFGKTEATGASGGDKPDLLELTIPKDSPTGKGNFGVRAENPFALGEFANFESEINVIR